MDSPPSTPQPQQPRKGMTTRSASNRKLPPKHPGGSSRSLMGKKKAPPAKKKAPPATTHASSSLATAQASLASPSSSSSGKRKASLLSFPSPTAKKKSSSSPMTQKMGRRKVESMEELKRILQIRETKPNQKTVSLAGKTVGSLHSFTKAPTAHTNLRLSADYSGYYGDPPRMIVPPDHPEIEDVTQEIMDEFYRPEDCDGLSVANAAHHLRELIWTKYDIDVQTISEDMILDYIMVRRNLNTTKFVSREEHDEFKTFFLHNEQRKEEREQREEERERRTQEQQNELLGTMTSKLQQQNRTQEQQTELLGAMTSKIEQQTRTQEQQTRTQEQQNELLGTMTSKLVNHDQQLAYLNSNAVMKDRHQSDLKEMATDILKNVEKKITDSETKLMKKIDYDETSEKIQPRSLNFGGPTSPSPSTASSSPFAHTHLGGASSSSSSSSSKSKPAAGPTFTFKAPDSRLAGPPASSSSNSAAGPFTFNAPSNSAAGPFTFNAPSNSAAGPFTFNAPSNSAAGPFTFNALSNSDSAASPFTFNAPDTQLGGPPAPSLLSSSNSAAGPFTFNAPSNSDSAAGPFTLSHDSKIPAVDPANLYDELSQIELPTVQVGSSSNIIVTDDNAPTTSVLPTEDIALPVRTRPFRLTLPAQAAPFIQAQPSSVQAQPSSVQGNAMNLSTQAQPSLFELFGAPQGWECKDCLLRNVEGAEVCFHCIEK